MCVKPYNAFLHLFWCNTKMLYIYFGVTKISYIYFGVTKNILHLLWYNITPTLSLNIHVSYHLIYVSVL